MLSYQFLNVLLHSLNMFIHYICHDGMEYVDKKLIPSFDIILTELFCYASVYHVDWHMKILDDPSPSLMDKGFSPELCSFIDDCLEKDPVARPTAEKVSMRRLFFRCGLK